MYAMNDYYIFKEMQGGKGYADLVLVPAKIKSPAIVIELKYEHSPDYALKQIKETLSEFGYIVQCHRAFLVNINFVVSMTARNPGYQLQLFGVEKQLPVSRANNDVIKSALSENS